MVFNGIDNRGTLIINGGNVSFKCEDSGKAIYTNGANDTGITKINGGNIEIFGGSPNYPIDTKQTVEISESLRIFAGTNSTDKSVINDRTADVTSILTSNRYLEATMPLAIKVDDTQYGSIAFTGATSTAKGYSAFAGDEVTIVATPDTNCKFRSAQAFLDGTITSVPVDSANKFTMPNQSVRIQAQFDPPKTEYIDITLNDWDDFSKGIASFDSDERKWNEAESSEGDTTWTENKMVTKDITINGNLIIDYEVDLLICDGATLTVNGSVIITDNQSLWIYGQENQTGTMYINAKDNNSAINGENLAIYGATIYAKANNAPALDLVKFDMLFGNLDAQAGEGFDALVVEKAISIYGTAVLKADSSYPATTTITVGSADMKAYLAGKRCVFISAEYYGKGPKKNETENKTDNNQTQITTESEETSNTQKAQNTGDNSQLSLYITLTLISSVTLGAVLVLRKKSESSCS